MKRILALLSEYGYWGEELVAPMDVLEEAGYSLDFMTVNGKKPHPLPPSIDENYIDPPLGRQVTSSEIAKRVIEVDNSDILDSPMIMKKLIPERPYFSSTNYLRELEKYYYALEHMESKIIEYDALLIVGGSGPIIDLVNNQRVHDLILAFKKLNKVIAAECYGVACLAFARDMRDRKSILLGKNVTGHPLEYDYKDGTGFLGVDLNMGPPPYPLEYILRDAVGENGKFIGNVGNKTSVIVDYPFITSRSTASSHLCGIKLVEVLQDGLVRYGW